MNKFFIFFLCSFTLHLALGGILLYRSGLLGKSSQVEVDTSSMEVEGEKVNELGEGVDSVKESELVMEAPPPPVKSVKKKKKKIPKKIKKASKPKKQKKIVPKEPVVSAPVEKPSVPLPVAKSSVPSDPILPSSESGNPVTESDNKVQEKEESTSEESALPAKPEGLLSPPVDSSNLASPSSESENPVKENDNEVQEETQEQKQEQEQKQKQKQEQEKEQILEQPSNLPSGNNIPVPAGKTPETARTFNQLKQIPGNPIPEYPREALGQKWEGKVEVLYYVNTGGFVEQIQVSHSSGHITLDNSAIKALSHYRYELGQEGWVSHQVDFLLEKDKEVKEIVPLRTMDDQ